MSVMTAPQIRLTPARVVRSEWIKFRSVRSTGWTLLAAVAFTIGFSALFTLLTMNAWDSMPADRRALLEPATAGTEGSNFAQLATGVLAILLVTGEYGTGMIRASLTAVPRRTPVLLAKVAVFAAVTFTVMLTASLIAFGICQSILSREGLNVSLGADGAWRAVVGQALYVTLAGVIAMALGALLRNTAAGITTMVLLFLVAPPLVGLLPSGLSGTLVKYLPSDAGLAIFSSFDGSLDPAAGFAVTLAYAGGLIAIAAWQLRRRDA